MEQRETAMTSATAVQEFHWVMAVRGPAGPHGGEQVREQSGVATAPHGHVVTRAALFDQIRAEVTAGWPGAVVAFWTVERNQL